MKNGIKLIVLFLTLLVLSLRSSGEGRSMTASAAGSPIIYLPCIMKACQNQIPYQPATDANKEAETLRLINAQRVANGGLAPLTMRDSLVQIARFHSIDMATHNLTSHDGSAGESPWTRFGWVCDTFSMEAEIIAWGFDGNVGRVVDAWMNSPGHRAIILTPGYTLAGVGYAVQSGSYWTVDFGSPPLPASLNMLAAHPRACTTQTTVLAEGGISVTSCK